MAEKLKVTKRLRSIPVDVEERDGTVREYELRGLLGPQRDEWAELMQSVQVDGKIPPKEQTALIAKLLSMTLIGPDKQAMMEEEATVLPSETQLTLFNEALKLSGMDAMAITAAKNV